MDKVFQLFDSRFKRNYVVTGDFKDLIPQLKFRFSLRNSLDKLFLIIQSWFLVSITKDIRLQLQLKTLDRCFNGEIDSFILFRTSWYKETQYIGIVNSLSKKYFIKIFKSFEDTMLQETQAGFIKSHFSNYFFIIPTEKYCENILVTPFIPLKRAVNSTDNIEQKIIQINTDLIQDSLINKTINDIIPLDLRMLFNDQPYLIASIDYWLKQNQIELPIIPVHGDVTSWNMFVNDSDEIVLADYETAGWHVPFYDYFHYILQPIALGSGSQSIRSINLSIDYPDKDKVLVLYLIDQLYKHYSEIKQHGFDDKHIINLIRNKSNWLLELLNEK